MKIDIETSPPMIWIKICFHNGHGSPSLISRYTCEFNITQYGDEEELQTPVHKESVKVQMHILDLGLVWLIQ